LDLREYLDLRRNGMAEWNAYLGASQSVLVLKRF
jgi:hypothetical protein